MTIKISQEVIEKALGVSKDGNFLVLSETTAYNLVYGFVCDIEITDYIPMCECPKCGKTWASAVAGKWATFTECAQCGNVFEKEPTKAAMADQRIFDEKMTRQSDAHAGRISDDPFEHGV